MKVWSGFFDLSAAPSDERLNSFRSVAFIFNETALSLFEDRFRFAGEADIGTGNKRDFASLLDDLFDASRQDEGEAGPRPSIPFDYLAVADELHSGRIKVSGETLAARYQESSADLGAEFAALLAQAKIALADEHSPPEEKLPPIDPEAIAGELGLDQPDAATNLGRLRRRFAFSNHPDRVPPHLRQRAMIRMQVANMLIDDAKRRAVAGARR